MKKEAKVVLSIDFGTQKIGLCIAETFTGQTKPLKIIKNDEKLLENIKKIIGEWQPDLYLIGSPPNPSASFSKNLSQFKIDFEEIFQEKLLVVDEDYTSQAVDHKKPSEMKDSLSAEIIFQDWFNKNYG